MPNHPDPPMHLVLGSEAIGLLRKDDASRLSDLEKWLSVSLSTDQTKAVNYLETIEGKAFLNPKAV